MSNDQATSEETKLISELTLDDLEAASGGLGTVIPSTYKKNDLTLTESLYAGFCLGLMGF